VSVESCLYTGRVLHRRSAPIRHEFVAPLFMLYLDLGELDRVFRGRWLWSARRPAPAWFRREDHLGDPGRPLEESVRELVEQRSGRRTRGPIRLLTHLRYFGIAFNPVSFFYCFDEGGRQLDAIVAEVTNTPWNERHCYVLAADGAEAGERLRFRTPKEFHVSPFMGMELDHVWSFGLPGRRLDVRIENAAGSAGRIFEAALELERRELGGLALAGVLARHPCMTLEVLARIYWQALRLRRAGAPFRPHPGRPAEPAPLGPGHPAPPGVEPTS
jgi:DUF1365 family protein